MRPKVSAEGQSISRGYACGAGRACTGGTFSQPGGRAGLGRRMFCVICPPGLAGSAGWPTDKADVQAGPGEHKGQRQACLILRDTVPGWVARAQVYQSPLTSLVGGRPGQTVLATKCKSRL